MQLPSAGMVAPRPSVPGSAPLLQSGAAAGFEAVMNGVLASDAKTAEEKASDGKASEVTAQQAPDGGAQEKPAATGSVPVARAAKPEGSKAAKDAVDAAGVVVGAVVVSAVPLAAAAVVVAMAPGTAAFPASGTGVAVPAKDGAVAGTVPAKGIAGTSAPASLTAGMPAGDVKATPVGTGVGAAVPAALPLGSLGQSPTQPGPIPVSQLPASPPSAVAQPTSTLPTGPLPGSPLPTMPLPVGPEPRVNATAAQPAGSATAVVLPVGKPATQQDPQPILGHDTPAAAAPGIQAGIQAGTPVVVQPASPLQPIPFTAAPGIATPTYQAEPSKLLPQVSGPLFSLASAAPGSHVMTLKLSPEDLGPLTVRAHIEGAGVRIELFAPGEAGREAVRSILPELRRGLGESGFGASLDLSEHNAPADAWAGGSDPRGADSRDRRPAESPAFPRGSDGDTVRLPRTAVVLPRSSTSSLDILV